MSVDLAHRYEERDCGHDTPCWVWTMCRGKRDGYGRIKVGGRKGRVRLAHILSFEIHRGPVPEGLHLDHLCRVRACINPDHLDPVTSAVNTRRGEKTKLKPGDVERIRALLTERKLTHAQIASRFGVARVTVTHIKAGRIWA